MIKNYIPQNKRKNILLITDDISVPTGVGIMGKEIVFNSCHIFNWINLGSIGNHPLKGKILDGSEDVSKLTGVKDPYVKIYPYDTYGDIKFLKFLIKKEKIDAILLITDPRYFTYLWEGENEIRDKVPISYYNIWDNYPVPYYNTPYYESCDLLMGISKLTFDVNKKALKDSLRPKPIFKYIPHGRDHKIFKKVEKNDPGLLEFKKNLIPQIKDDSFVLLFNSRNMMRKNIPSTIEAWGHFMDSLSKKEKSNCYFILHTNPYSSKGTDLNAVINEILGENYNIIINNTQYEDKEMNLLYNMADGVVLASVNEGWGLSLTEGLLTKTPIIANMTGGMKDQLNWNCLYESFKLKPKVKKIIGSQNTPYIYEEICSMEDISMAIKDLYECSENERNFIGDLGFKHAIKEGYTSEVMTKRIVEALNELFKTWKPRDKYYIEKVI